MTTNRRIFLNIVATYGRSLYALVIGLFCGRWTLMALGQTDYGLMGLIGGLTMFISYFNSILATAIGRFFAFAVGQAETDRVKGMESCHQWFTTAVVLHTVVPVLLIIIGYPLGVWAINTKLVIPQDRITDCIWVWRFVCSTCFLGMVSVPFNAMYNAKQYIAELTLYSFITTTFNAIFLYYMVSHPGVWLVPYMFFQCLLGLLPQAIIATRACYIFEECRFRWKYVNCLGRIKQLGSYSLWTAWGIFGGVCRNQGLAVMTNLFFGPRVNAGLGIGGTVSAQCDTLSGSMTGAFSPAIINAWGAERYQEARDLAFRTCKLGTLFILVFALPLFFEVDEVLKLWLKNPPLYANGFCVLVLLMGLIERLSTGHQIMVNANGKVALYQCFAGTSLVLAIPICWILVKLNIGPYSIGWAMVLSMALCTASRIIFARSLVGMSLRYWLMRIFLPLLLVSAISLGVGSLLKLTMPPSFWRIVIITLVIEIVLMPSSWFFILDAPERMYVAQRFGKIIERVRSHKK